MLDIIGPDRDVEPQDLPRLKYLERFIKETQRLFPAAPVILRSVHKDIDIGKISQQCFYSIRFLLFLYFTYQFRCQLFSI